MTLVGIAAAYFLLARLSLLLSFQSSNATPVWPPSGLAFALILYYGLRVAPAIFVGAFAANFVVFQLNHATSISTSAWVSLLISIGNTVESIAGAWLLKKVLPHVKDNGYFDRVGHIFRFVFAVVIMCLIASMVGTAAVYAGSIISTTEIFRTWLTWWLGDLSGIILFTPAILTWFFFWQQKTTPAFSKPKRFNSSTETLILLALIALASGIVFDNWIFSVIVFRWPFWIIPVLVWAGIRFRKHEAIAAILVCSVISIWGTINGHGPFSDITGGREDYISFNESLLILQSFTCIVTITALILNASVSERRETEAMLRNLSNELETRVATRTAELSERNIFIETVFDSVVDIMAVFDREGKYISVNKKVEEVYNVNRSDLIGRHVLDVFPALKGSDLVVNLQKALAGEAIRHIGYRSPVTSRYYENFYIPLRNDNKEIYGVLVIAHDNTDIKDAAENIEIINTRLTEAQRLAHIGNWEWDILNDRITWSDEMYRIFGLTPRSIEPSFDHYLRLIHPEERDTVNNIVQSAYETHKPFHFYHRLIRPDGTTRILHGRGQVHLGDEGTPIGMAGTAQDVTDQKKAEDEIRKITDDLQRYIKELEQTNKELESFTYVASHDLQEPIRKIRVFLSLIMDRNADTLSDTSKNYIDRTVRAATQMQTLINDLLLYSRTMGSSLHFVSTDLNEIVQQAINELKESIEEKQAVVQVDKLPVLNVIPFQVHQFFVNMLSNSLKFTHEGVKPRIIIDSGLADPASLNNFSADSTKTYYRISIADNGIGFDAKYSEKIFDLFQRLHNRDRYIGTGIGLSICKKIIENHDGFITAEGRPGEGARFTVFLPLKSLPEQ